MTPNQDAGLPILVEYDYVDAADRRFDLIALVMNAESLRGGGSRIRRQMVCVCQGECDHLTRRWNGDLDRGWAEGELAKVKAEPGEYIEESYERWRLSGLPIWAAMAAGMKAGRRTRLVRHHRFVGKFFCTCGTIVRTSGAIPNPNEWHLIADEDFDPEMSGMDLLGHSILA